LKQPIGVWEVWTGVEEPELPDVAPPELAPELLPDGPTGVTPPEEDPEPPDDELPAPAPPEVAPLLDPPLEDEDPELPDAAPLELAPELLPDGPTGATPPDDDPGAAVAPVL
jgi:hypothetical protein